MALSNDELQSQSAAYLPAREVMSLIGGGGCGGWWGCDGGLVDVDLHDVDIVKNINILNGDNDVVDIDNIVITHVL